MNKKALTEADIRTKFITPALIGANNDKWNVMTQIREETYFTKGRVIVRGKTVKRGEAKKADYILSYKPNFPLAVLEAKDNNHSVGSGMQQALEYAEILDVPFAYSSNGDAFLEHDRTATSGTVTREIPLDQFPTPDELWARYRKAKGYTAGQEAVATQDYYDYGTQKSPRYYQLIAINRTVDAIARGENRILLVMATGTGKTYTAFQIIWRLWKSGAKKRILFLVDRNILADQTKTNDFKPFGAAMTKITNRTVDKAFEIYLCLYQAVTGTEEEQNIYQQFSPDFFDLIVIDECHRGSAADDAAWRKVLEYFSSATQIGLTATPKETKDVSNIEYFGDPIYTYSLRQGISDGFLAPYKVVRIGLDKDLDGWRPETGQTDKHGHLIEDREYNDRDFDQNLILEKRTELVAAKVTEFLRATDRFAKTIIFCENIDHAERMRQAMVNANPDLAAANSKYVMRITGNNDEGKAQLDNFIDPESTYLLKLHGNLDNAAERVLNKAEYDAAYGNDGNIHFDCPLPKLLKRLFTSYSFLFLGTSLSADRTIQTFMRVAQLEGQDNLPHHYALLASPSDADRKRVIDQRLADAHISPIWFPEGEFQHIEEILQLLLD